MSADYYLKPNVVIEPLVNRWYAWSHLISPATAAMNVVKRHLMIMQSFINSPEVHRQAVRNPKLKGGPFMDIDISRVEEVRKLMNDTLKRQAKLMELCHSIDRLNSILCKEAKGYGLESLYQKVPETLKGYVELYYDLFNNPGFRFYESLIYNSAFYDTTVQSIALWLTDNDHRPFCLSTPRLNDSSVIFADMPFKSEIIDKLAEMKRIGGDPNYIKDLLGVEKVQDELFESFFTAEKPPAYQRYCGDKIRMRYFGHACILIETKEVSILVDPLISYYGYDSDIDHFSDIHLPDSIDYVLITHNHQDHILLETILPLRHRIKKLIVPQNFNGKLQDPDLKAMLNNIGFSNVHALAEMEQVKFSDAVITALPFMGEHSDLNIYSKACYHVEIGGFTALFMADSRVVEPALYEHVKKNTGEVDVLFLGMECDGAPLSWLYGPLMPDKLPYDQDMSRRLAGSDCSAGISLVNIFKPVEAYVYAMGQEPWLEFISSIKYTSDSNPIIQSDKFIGKCRDAGVLAERLFGEKEILYSKKNPA